MGLVRLMKSLVGLNLSQLVYVTSDWINHLYGRIGLRSFYTLQSAKFSESAVIYRYS